MIDGMTSERMSVDQLDVGSCVASIVLSGASLAVAAAQIDATELAADSVGTSEQGFVGTGSPPSFDAKVLYGSSAMPAATSEWIVFGTTFGVLPSIAIGGNAAVTITNENAGSFLASGANTTIYHWIAMGST